MMNYTEILSRLKALGQEHLLRFYDDLSADKQLTLLKKLGETDFSYLAAFASRMAEVPRGEITPIPVLRIREIEEKRAAYEAAGLRALSEGKAAAVLLAGGSGSRLGHEGPKGTFDIGISRPVFIFQRLIENLSATAARAGRPLTLFIMTSETNDAETRAFFEAHGFFGYDPSFVHFFTQAMAPAVDENGKILMETASRPVSAPNGNGGWLLSMEASGMLDIARREGVEWLNVFSVDNVLQQICDPVFLGATITSGCASGSKVVRKTSPEEKVGVMCLENGRTAVVEYYELSDEMRNAKDENGNYLYYYGVILNYLFRIEDAAAVMHEQMPVHFAHKKIPCIDAEGRQVTPDEPNGWKFEYFIFDLLHELNGCLAFEIDRDREFAPVKNRTGADSPETARALLLAQGISL